MQKPIKKIKNGTFTFNAPTNAYNKKGWALKSYTISLLNEVSTFTRLEFSNGEVLTGSWPVPESRMSVQKDIERRGKGFHYGDFPHCYGCGQLNNKDLERGSDQWVEEDPEMEKYPHIKEVILSFEEGEGRSEEEIYNLYREVSRGWTKMPSSWQHYHQMQLKEKARYDRSMRSAPSKKDEM